MYFVVAVEKSNRISSKDSVVSGIDMLLSLDDSWETSASSRVHGDEKKIKVIIKNALLNVIGRQFKDSGYYRTFSCRKKWKGCCWWVKIQSQTMTTERWMCCWKRRLPVMWNFYAKFKCSDVIREYAFTTVLPWNNWRFRTRMSWNHRWRAVSRNYNSYTKRLR